MDKDFRGKVASLVDPAWGDFHTLEDGVYLWKPFDNAPTGIGEIRVFYATFFEEEGKPSPEQRVKEELLKNLVLLKTGSFLLEVTRKHNSERRLTECLASLTHCSFPQSME